MHSAVRSLACVTLFLGAGCSERAQPNAPGDLPAAMSIPDARASGELQDEQSERQDAERPNAGLESAERGVRDELNADLDPADRDVFAWFDSLGFPDLAGRRFVGVGRGVKSKQGDEPDSTNLDRAFLLHDGPDEFTVITLELSTLTLDKSPADDDHEQGWFERLDLAREAAAIVQRLRNPASKETPWRRFRRMAGERSEIFVLARACAANGLADLAHELIGEAAKIPSQQSGNIPGPGGLPTALSDEIGDSMMWSNVLALGEPSIGRPDLLKRFRDFERRFPTNQYAARAAEISTILAQMVDEDVEHARWERKPLDEMAVPERVAELIYQLRDQNGHQFSNPGSCDIFLGPRDGGLIGRLLGEEPRGGGSPASQLVAIGFDAVPQLIEHLDDARLTRSIGFHRSFYFSHHALRVGDCAQQILEKIAGQSFYERTYTNAQMFKDNKARDVKHLVEQWWADVQKKGEMHVLVENVGTGGKNSPRQAQQLLKKYPQVALDAVFEGVQNAKDSWVRVALIELAAGVAGDQTTEFLLEQMKSGHDLTARVACGRALAARHHPAAVPAMIREWNMLRAEPHASARATFDGRDDGIDQLIQVLAVSGSPDAIRTLAAQLESQAVGRRLAVISAFGRRVGDFGMASSGTGGALNIPDDQVTDFTGLAQAALEKLLIHSLSDLEERAGLSGHWNGKAFADPRLCDIAAHVLADRIPAKYAFDLEAPRPVRDRMRTIMKNVWRGEHGLPLLPVPEPVRITRLPDEQTRLLVKEVRDATSDDERSKATAALGNLGLPALPAVIEELDALAQNHAARPALRALAAELACIVNEIEWAESSTDPGDAFRAQINEMKAKSLDSQTIVDLLVALTREPPAGITGIKLAAERYSDRTGVHMRVAFTNRRIATIGTQKGWESLVRVDLETNSLHNSQGFSSFEHAKEESAYSELANAIDKAVAAPPDAPFEIRISLVQSE